MVCLSVTAGEHFNSRPHGGRLPCLKKCRKMLLFQLTPSRRATVSGQTYNIRSMLFQLTPSRRATPIDVYVNEWYNISTHALTEGDKYATFAKAHDTISTHALTEGDRNFILRLCEVRYFNSRPHGGRRATLEFEDMDLAFQLTPSRRATFGANLQHTKHVISTHALTEGDRSRCTAPYYEGHFNSRPHGGRRQI